MLSETVVSMITYLLDENGVCCRGDHWRLVCEALVEGREYNAWGMHEVY